MTQTQTPGVESLDVARNGWLNSFAEFCDEPVFPCTDREKEKPGETTFTGITRVEYVAAHILQGLYANAALADIKNYSFSSHAIGYAFDLCKLQFERLYGQQPS